MTDTKEEVKDTVPDNESSSSDEEKKPETKDEKIAREKKEEEDAEKKRHDDMENTRKQMKEEKAKEEAERRANESDDLIDILESYNTGQKLLSKLGIDNGQKPQKTEAQLKHEREKNESLEKQKADAHKMVAAAQKKLESIKKTSIDLEKQVENLLQQTKDKDKQLIAEEHRTNRIMELHKKKMDKFRNNQISEIFWIMKEQQETHDDKDPYYFIIHSYLVELWLEDHVGKEEELAQDINEKIKQVFANFKKQFDHIIKHVKTPEQFEKLMPKPVPKGKIQKENYNLFLQHYHPWAQKNFDEWHAEVFEEENILMSEAPSDFSHSAEGSSVAEQSKLDQDKVAEGLKDVAAIPEENENN